MSPRISSDAADKAFGERIAELRKIRGIFQEQLGASIGVNQKQMSKYEAGSPFPISRLELLFMALDTTPNHFFEYFDIKGGGSEKLSASVVAIAKSIQKLPSGSRHPVMRLVADLSKQRSSKS